MYTLRASHAECQVLCPRGVIFLSSLMGRLLITVHYACRWHHIYLPLLPKTFKDYLTAPMPFMVGLPAALLPVLRNIPMDEVTLIDLDLGKCDPAPGSARDDAQYLPWRGHLEAALTAAYANLKSPTEYESSPLIAGEQMTHT